MEERKRKKRRHDGDSSTSSDEGKVRKTERISSERPQIAKNKKSKKKSRDSSVSSSSSSVIEHSNSSDYCKKKKKRKDRDKEKAKSRRKKGKRKSKREKKEKKRKRRKEREEKKATADKTMEKDVYTKVHTEVATLKKPVSADHGCDAPLKKRSMVPMTKEEYEKQQAQITRVYDPETGRHRLVKGTGEILEEIVSRDRHKAINKTATLGDGAFFQANLGLKDK